jgi:geranylgeranyl transferase type-2 subunit alpha
MHGRPRQRAAGETSGAENDKELAKVAQLQELIPSILHNHRTCCYTKEALIQNAKLLELNPEFYTAWNFRKRAVQHLLSSETDEEARKRIIKEELDLVYRALKVNPKSYGAWHHRKWVIALGLSPLDSEFTLLSKVLKLDARNFHSWNYRRFFLSLSLSLSLSLTHTHTHTLFVNIFVPPKIVEFFLSLQMHAAHLFFG